MADSDADRLAGARAVNVVLREMLEAERQRAQAYRDALTRIDVLHEQECSELMFTQACDVARAAIGKEPTK